MLVSSFEACCNLTRCRNLVGIGLVAITGCATWLPSEREPAPITKGFNQTESSKDTVGVETLLLRLDSNQAARLNELWLQIDEQSLAPESRTELDRNGLRAGKLSGSLPPLLDQWVQANEQRIADDPMEQTGLASDISAYAHLWRCKPGMRKEISIRNVPNAGLCVFYHDGSAKGRYFDSPQFFYVLQTTPFGDSSAKIKLTPEMQHGDFVREVIARDAALRPVTRRETIAWDKLSVELRLNRGDLIVIGPTEVGRGLGEHFFHTKTQNGDMQPVLLLAKLIETRLDDAFNPEESARASRNPDVR